MKHLALASACPCGRISSSGRPLTFGACCGRWLETDVPAPDPESLMRSRYCAFVLERAQYLLATWHTTQRPTELEFEPGVKWLGLDVRYVEFVDETHAEVEFVARNKPQQGAAVRLQERSQFVREQDRWYYLTATLPPA